LRKMGGITSVYIPKARMEMFLKLKEWCEAHNKSWVEVALDQIEKVDLEKAYPEITMNSGRWRICEYSLGQLRKGEFLCSREQLWHLPVACDRCNFFKRVKA
jgi:hypothetical protein